MDSKDKILNLLLSCDGNHTIDEISNQYNMDADQVYHAIHICANTGLIESSKENRKTELKAFTINIARIPCKRFFDSIRGHINAVMMTLLIVFLLLSAIDIVFVAKMGLPIFYNSNSKMFFSILLSFILMIPSFLFHETFHGIVSTKYGFMPSNINFSLYMIVAPMAYIEIPNLYTCNPAKRIKIMSSGFLGNIYLIAISLFLYYMTGINVFLSLLWAQINIIQVNLSPLQLTDSYFIFSTIIKEPNLRLDFFKTVAHFNKHVRKKVVVYGVISIIMMYISSVYYIGYISPVIVFPPQVKYFTMFLGALVILFIYLAVIYFRYR